MGKLTYDQMRHLADLGTDGGRLTIKNKKGLVLKPTLKKWHQSPKATLFMFTGVQPTQSHAPSAHAVVQNGRFGDSNNNRPVRSQARQLFWRVY